MSAATFEFGTELPIRDVRCHGEYWGESGLAADLVKMARLTHLRHSPSTRHIYHRRENG
jgi:hypothetical protein